MQHDPIQMRTAVRMFIRFLLEHRDQLKNEMNATPQQEPEDTAKKKHRNQP